MKDKYKGGEIAGVNKKEIAMNRTVVGGVVGAGIGLLSSPQTSKRVIISIGQSEIIRSMGRELGRSARELAMEQVMKSIKQTTAGMVDQGDSSEKYRTLKEENRKMSEHLQLLEQKIDEMNKKTS